MKNLHKSFILELSKLRKQGLEVSDINPISALADKIYDKLYTGKLTKKDIRYTLEKISENLWKEQIINIRRKAATDKNIQEISEDTIKINISYFYNIYSIKYRMEYFFDTITQE